MRGTTYRDHGIDAPAHGSGEYRATCPECSHGRTKRTEKCLSVNLDRRTWFCHHCGWAGGLPEERPQDPPQRLPDSASPVGQAKAGPLTQGALAWLRSRGISKATADAAGLHWALVWFSVNESEYIGGALTLLRNIARRESIALFIAAHPTKMEKQAGGEYGIPTPYDISGSANWRNKADVCLAVWRPLAKPEPWADIHIQKVRHRDAGRLGKCRLHWHPSTGNYGDRAA